VKASVVLEQKRRLDRRRLALAMLGAILLHVWLLYTKFPEFGPATIVRVQTPVRLKRYRPRQRVKEPVKPKIIKRKRFKAVIPVPDPTPDEPEPIVAPEEEPPVEIPEDVEFVWGEPEEPEPEAPSGPGEEYRVYNPWEVSKAPEVLKEVKPQYPEIAKLAGVRAIVVLQLVVDEKGHVQNAIILHSTGGQFKKKFEEAAIAAVYGYEFKPAVQAGHPVPCLVKITVRFRLE